MPDPEHQTALEDEEAAVGRLRQAEEKTLHRIELEEMIEDAAFGLGEIEQSLTEGGGLVDSILRDHCTISR